MTGRVAIPSPFVVTTDELVSFFTKSARGQRTVLSSESEEGGTDLHCSVLNDKGELLVARRGAVFTYDAEERRECYVLSEPKKSLHLTI